VRHRIARADGCESRRTRLFHSHAYFDHTAPERVAEARGFMDLIRRTFAATDDVRARTRLQDLPACEAGRALVDAEAGRDEAGPTGRRRRLLD